ncbi:MAG TPA: hypothetical protein VH062_36785 [Polyangiaceae bacterium]|jgi:hypothetical protein|nr:hypothetical protein [Polyangiaceae bacterium]
MTSIKTNDDLHAKLNELTAFRDQAKTWLGQLDAKPPDAVAAESEIESTVSHVHAMTAFIDGVAEFEESLRNGKTLVARRSWVEADEAWDEALHKVSALQAADPSFRAFVVGGFDPDRKKAEVMALKASIAGAVASARKQQVAAEAAPLKRRGAPSSSENPARSSPTSSDQGQRSPSSKRMRPGRPTTGRTSRRIGAQCLTPQESPRFLRTICSARSRRVASPRSFANKLRRCSGT